MTKNVDKYEKFTQLQKVIWKHNEINLTKFACEGLFFALGVAALLFISLG